MKKYKPTVNEQEEKLRKNPINVFTCCEKTMEFKDFKEHLSSVHKLREDQFKGSKKMLAHIDGDYWFSYNYQWELESGLKFHQHIEMARAQDDPMRYY